MVLGILYEGERILPGQKVPMNSNLGLILGNGKDNFNEIFDQELHEHFAFDIDNGQEPLRIDKFLMNRIENATRNKIQKAAKEGSIRVNEIIVKSSYKVKKAIK
ncbi:MAG: hypothetical protein CM15mP102_22190 [Flavobacteriales bacterium]|nr:MAG: hypothetical protein CM15mP102_22190 [Flavobacteriales bacterium]